MLARRAAILQCFWPASILEYPEQDSHVWVCPTKFANLGHVAKLVVTNEISEEYGTPIVRVVRPYEFAPSTVLIARIWLELRKTDAPSTNIVKSGLRWVGPVTAAFDPYDQPDVACVTQKMTGAFKDDPQMEERFFRLIQGQR